MGILAFVVITPFIVYIALRNERIMMHRVIYGAIVAIADIGLISWFLAHIHRAGLTLPSLIKFYIEYLPRMR